MEPKGNHMTKLIESNQRQISSLFAILFAVAFLGVECDSPSNNNNGNVNNNGELSWSGQPGVVKVTMYSGLVTVTACRVSCVVPSAGTWSYVPCTSVPHSTEPE